MLKASYIRSLTPMRGIAALWVVLFHIDVCIFYRDMGALAPRDLTGILSQGYLWVDFFFLLSGFIVAHVYGDQLSAHKNWPTITRYLWARFSRLYPLHLFTLSLLVLFAAVVPLIFPQVIDGSWTTYFSWAALPSNLLLTNSMNQHVYLSWNMVSWSIGAEWWTYVAAVILLVAINKGRLITVLGFMALAGAGLCALVGWLPENNLDITFNYGFLRCLFEFVMGIGVYELYRKKIGLGWLAHDAVVVVLMLSVGAIFHWRLFDLAIIPVFALLILAVSYNNTRVYAWLNKPVVQYLGEISYSVYLMHGVWFMVFWYSFPPLKLATGVTQLPWWSKVLYTLLFLSLTVLSAHFSYRYVEVAGRQWLRKFGPGSGAVEGGTTEVVVNRNPVKEDSLLP